MLSLLTCFSRGPGREVPWEPWSNLPSSPWQPTKAHGYPLLNEGMKEASHCHPQTSIPPQVELSFPTPASHLTCRVLLERGLGDGPGAPLCLYSQPPAGTGALGSGRGFRPSLTPYFNVLPVLISFPYILPFPASSHTPRQEGGLGEKGGRDRTLTNAAGLGLRLPQAPSTAGPAVNPGLRYPGSHQQDPCLLQGHPGSWKLRQEAG